MLISRNFCLIHPISQPAFQATDHRAVSYTHLDVYKRQEQEHAAQIARTGDGERCVCGAKPALRRQNGVLAGGDKCLFAAHQLIQLLGDLSLIHI